MSIRIAVVDSGVHLQHPHIIARTHGVAIGAEDSDPSFADGLGHGTAVMAAIQEKAPHAEYYAVKIFGDCLRTTVDHLVRGIDWAIENRMHLVNLSLGVTGPQYQPLLADVVHRARAAGVILVSAWEAGGKRAMPGCMDGVIGVELDWDLPRSRFRVMDGGPVRFAASGYPRTLPGVPPERNLNGISFAVANMTGFAAQALQRRGAASVDELIETLRDGSRIFDHVPELVNS